jgi:hypothetical protein
MVFSKGASPMLLSEPREISWGMSWDGKGGSIGIRREFSGKIL